MTSLMINAGIPEWRVKTCAGLVRSGKHAETGGHAYTIYLRQKSNGQYDWIIMDWCYLPIISSIQQRPSFKDQKEYLEIWYAFNSEYCWSNGNGRGDHKSIHIGNNLKL